MNGAQAAPVNPAVRGKVALVRRGSCTFVEKANNVFLAGETKAYLCSDLSELVSDIIRYSSSSSQLDTYKWATSFDRRSAGPDGLYALGNTLADLIIALKEAALQAAGSELL